MCGQRQNILGPLAQGRHVEFHDVQSIKQVFAKASHLDFIVHVAVAGRKDAGVGVDFRIGADALKASVLGHPQQFGLKLR